jgi:hypothetical protein
MFEHEKYNTKIRKKISFRKMMEKINEIIGLTKGRNAARLFKDDDYNTKFREKKFT